MYVVSGILARKKLGFTFFKMDVTTNFVGVKPGNLDSGGIPTDKGLEYGGELIAAVRDAIGWDMPLSVDASSLRCATVFERQPATEKRTVLRFVVNQCTWKNGQLEFEYHKPFDLIAEFEQAEKEKAQKAALEPQRPRRLRSSWGPGSHRRPRSCADRGPRRRGSSSSQNWPRLIIGSPKLPPRGIRAPR